MAVSYQFTTTGDVDERQLEAEFANASFGSKFEDLYLKDDTTIEAWFTVDLTVDEQVEADNLVANHVPSAIYIEDEDALSQQVYYANGLVDRIEYTDPSSGALIRKDTFTYDANNRLQSITTEWYYGLSIVFDTEIKTITYDQNTGLILKIE